MPLPLPTAQPKAPGGDDDEFWEASSNFPEDGSPSKRRDAVARRAFKGPLEHACWPDPDPQVGSSENVLADDVSRLSATPVDRIFYIRCIDDVKRVLAYALQRGLHVSPRGTKHCMGGQAIARDGCIVDMSLMRKMSYDVDKQLVTTESGAVWADLIKYLNQFGMSPRTMQSYSTFSVGGCISANAHGITTDFSMSECVESFLLITWDGTEVICRRDAEGVPGELYRLAIGGFGLFGVIVEVTMRVNTNCHLFCECLQVGVQEFVDMYQSAQEDEDVEIKLARLNIIDTDRIDFFVFRRAQRSDQRTVTVLTREPRVMSTTSRLMYKWLYPSLKEARYALEARTGVAIDWSGADERNLLMYESAEPLAMLYEPLWRVDDTFILQEYFVPRSNFKKWITLTKSIYAELARHDKLVLINTTIRFVWHDKDVCLPYACEEGSFAFVLYYRLPRTTECEAELHRFQSLFNQVTLKLGGSFYLCYRHHHTHDEMLQAYPRLPEFASKKERYDPKGLFHSLFFAEYGVPHCTSSYRELLGRAEPEPLLPAPLSSFASIEAKADGAFMPPRVEERRCDSYRKLVGDPQLRMEFKDGFLKQIFSVMDNEQLYRLILKSARNPQNKTDIEVYRALQRELGKLGGALHEATKVWRSIMQLSAQKKELVRETASILSRLGKMGEVHNYVSVGDHGKMVGAFREFIGMRGEVWILHDVLSHDIPAVLERGSVEEAGKYCPWELGEAGEFAVPSASADLVTMNQGLHHLKQDRIMPFLAEVYRVLRPGGLFIVREHDASAELMPMLDLAHSVFNCVLGVSDKEEETEIRAFRSILEWRKIIEASGLCDSMLYEMERGDPTWDEMMCFYKPPFRAPYTPPPPLPPAVSTIAPKSAVLGIPPQLAAFMDQAPKALLEGLKFLLDALLTQIPTVSSWVKDKAKALSTGQHYVAESLIDQLTTPVLNVLKHLRPFFDQAKLVEDRGNDFPPKELFLLVPALLAKAERGEASAGELFAVGLLKDIGEAFSTRTKEEEASPEDAAPTPSTRAADVECKEVSVAEVDALLQELLTVFPELGTPNFINDIGLDIRARSGLWSKLEEQSKEGKLDTEAFAATLADKLDDQAWSELQVALQEAMSRKMPLHMSYVFGKSGGADNPWCKAFMAFLGSPRVNFTSRDTLACSWIGLGDVPRMWKVAQKLRRKQQQSSQLRPKLVRTSSDLQRSNRMAAAMQDFEASVREVCMKEGAFRDLDNVGELLEAKFGYTSLTASLSDVTEEVKAKYLNGTKLLLKGQNIRDECTDAGLLDSMRKNALGKQNALYLKYRSCADPEPEILLPRVNALLNRMGAMGITSNAGENNGEFTFYKLNEWMQVEIMQIFGENLRVTPWYRFPFMEFMQIYFEVLAKEAGVVQGKFGPKKAFLSPGFMVSFVPGIIMSIYFAQLELMALPCKMMFGDNYDESKMVEELVVQLPKDRIIDWNKVDQRIQKHTMICPGLWVISVPTFLPFTSILLRLAKEPNMRVLQISNQRQVQVLVTLRDEREQLGQLQCLPGCQVLFNYKFPTDGSNMPPGLRVTLCVNVPYLLSTLRSCQRLQVEIVQVYDFWS
eukprot:TRINITY_DN27413_c0_g1_i1.p1 TRINITY_DN27413_c0_g1~~TRINITY_DN27413_c0_g1_i1.p1  ORF type:complete len:1588 (+),score=423.13 TRINITY_DN27413_c0_g1_i1:99-4862(+)